MIKLPLSANIPATVLESSAKSFAFISLGCPKNTVDSERMLGKLAQDGYALQPDAHGADVVVINTCGFIESARQESLSVIREMLALKAQGHVGAVVVAGCLAERQGDMLLETVPEVDQIVGVFGREEIVSVVDRALAQRNEQRSLFRPAPVRAFEDTARLRITPRHYAYLKISEGCDRLCTYCAIPKMRGKHITKPMEEVIREANELVADGVRELMIVAQDSTYYGLDLYGKPRFAELLRELDRVPGLEWIRVLYAYPEYFTDDLIATMAGAKKIVPYLDMPLQHISDRVLRRMVRRVDRAQTESLLGRLRSAIPNLAMRTTFIVGFPGEAEEEFEYLLDFIERTRFERLGVFTYSQEEGSRAAKMEGQLPQKVKAARYKRAMKLQQRIAREVSAASVGKTLRALVDQPLVARAAADAPDIDGRILLSRPAPVGEFIDVEITGTQVYDLIGTPVL